MKRNKNYQNLNKLEKENQQLENDSKFLSLSQESINSINSNNEEIYSNKKDWKLAVKTIKKDQMKILLWIQSTYWFVMRLKFMFIKI